MATKPGEKTRRTTAKLPDSLHRRIKKACIDADTTIDEWIHDAAVRKLGGTLPEVLPAKVPSTTRKSAIADQPCSGVKLNQAHRANLEHHQKLEFILKHAGGRVKHLVLESLEVFFEAAKASVDPVEASATDHGSGSTKPQRRRRPHPKPAKVAE